MSHNPKHFSAGLQISPFPSPPPHLKLTQSASMAKKRKVVANPARGFATTSTPSKAKPPASSTDETPSKVGAQVSIIPEASEGEGGKIEAEYTIPTEEEQEDFELQCLVEKHGPKVRKEAQRIVNRMEAEKRTIRNICFPLKLERILRFNLTRYASKQRPEESEQEIGLGDQILRLAREEYAQHQVEKDNGWKGETVLVNGWVLHRVLIAMGFPLKRVEEGLRALAGMSTNMLDKEKGLESAIEEILDWLALYCDEDELPGFLGTIGTGNAEKKGGDLESSGEFHLNPEVESRVRLICDISKM